MKKEYTKPQIMFEDFTLSTNIAAGCEHQNVLPTNGTQGCGMAYGNLVIFVDTNACDLSVGRDDGEYGGICYHVPADQGNVFTS